MESISLILLALCLIKLFSQTNELMLRDFVLGLSLEIGVGEDPVLVDLNRVTSEHSNELACGVIVVDERIVLVVTSTPRVGLGVWDPVTVRGIEAIDLVLTREAEKDLSVCGPLRLLAYKFLAV